MGLFDLFKKKETIFREMCNNGNALMRANRYEEALKIYNQAINLNPQDSFLYRDKANALLEMKRYDEAIQAFNQAVKLNPNFGDAYANIGSALMELGRYKEALQTYEKAGRADEHSDDRFDCKKDHRGCYRSVSSFHSLMEKKCDALLKMGKYEETIKVAYDGLGVPGEDYNQYVEYVSKSLQKMGKHEEEEEYIFRKCCEADLLLDEYRYSDARALMHMSIGYLMRYKLNIKE